MPKLSHEKRVGIFFVITILLTITVIFFFGKIRPFRKGYHILVTFNHVAGLSVGNEVRLAGLKIGEVSSLEMTKNKILVKLWVQGKNKIGKDSKITISQVSVMGGKYLSISPGSPESSLIFPGETVIGTDPPQFEDMIEEIGKAGDEIKTTIMNLSDSFSKTSDETHQILEENREAVKTLINSLNETTQSLNKILTKIEKGEGTIGKLINEEDIYNETLKTVRDLQNTIKKIEPHLKATMENVETITERLEKGEGTIGKLLTSDEMYEKAKNVMDSAEKISGKARKMMTTYEEFRAVLGYEGEYIFDEEGTRQEGFLRIEPSSSSYYLLGVSQEPWEETAKATVQVARRFYDDSLTLRSGVIEASWGTGIDYMFPNDKTSITLEGFEDSRDKKPYLRFRLNHNIWKNYYITLGASDLTDNPTFTAGARIEYDVLGVR